MITSKQAIVMAETEGFCRIKHKHYLCKTSEAAECIKAEICKPYLLIIDGDWSVPHGVADEHDKQLIEVCK